MLQAALVGFAVGGALLEIVVFDLFYTFAIMSMIVHILVLESLKQGNRPQASDNLFPDDWLIDPTPMPAHTKQ
jgi:hypothetical protein